MLEMDLPAPAFSQSEVSGAKVRVVLRNNIAVRKAWVDSDVAAIIGAAIAATLSENEKQILNFVAIHQHIHVSEAQRLTAHNWHTSRKLLLRLCERGILEYVHEGSEGEVDRKAHFVLRAKKRKTANRNP